jgi:serine/threonine protein kinase
MPEVMVWPPPKILASPDDGASPAAGGAERQNPRPGAPEPSGAGATLPAPTPSHIPFDWLEHPEHLVNGVLGERYRITSLLGRGPMGIACEGESSRGRQVTLKLLPRPPGLSLEHFAWQVRQTLALAHFDHPHVAPITDFGALEDGSAFVSRNRVPGVTLRTMLRQGGLPVRRSLSIARQIAMALAAAHQQDIAHGRLKPENVVVQGGAGPGDVIKVVDFGMAGLPVDLRAVAPSENDARRFDLRTRLYLPALAPAAATPAVDVYSLGVILFEMIAGQPPFVFEGAGVAGPPLSFAECNPPINVPAAVSDLVVGMMHPDAARHGISAQRLVELIEALLGRPSVAPPSEPAPSRPSDTYAASDNASFPPAAPQGPAPDAHGPAASAEPAPFWPPARQAGSGQGSWPPLPQGFSSSSAPPEVAPAQRRSHPPAYPPQGYAPPSQSAPAPPYPPPTQSALAHSPYPPPSRSAPAHSPYPPPSQSAPAHSPYPPRVQLHPAQSPSHSPYPPSAQSGPSYPPQAYPGGPATEAASGTYPSAHPARPSAEQHARAPSFGVPSPEGDDETDFRPSLLGRLRRLFGRSKPRAGF